MKDLIQDSL